VQPHRPAPDLADSSPASRSPPFYPASGPFPAPCRGDYFFADHVNGFVPRLALVNGNAAYAFARVFNAPVDLLVGTDGALYVLTRGSITSISAP
jgi:hypothetical protein